MPQMPAIRGYRNTSNVGRASGQVLGVPLAEKSVGPELKELGRNLQNTGKVINAYAESKMMTDSQSWIERGNQQSIRLNTNRMYDAKNSGRTVTKEEIDDYYFVKDEKGLTQADKEGLKNAGVEANSFSGRMFLRGFRSSNAKNYPQALQVAEVNSKWNVVQALNENKAESLKIVNVENLDQKLFINNSLLDEQFLSKKEKSAYKKTFEIDATNRAVSNALEVESANLSGGLEDKLQEIDDLGDKYKGFVSGRESGYYDSKQVNSKKTAIDLWVQKKKQRVIESDKIMKNKLKEREKNSLAFLQSEGDQQYFDKSTPEGKLEYAKSKVYMVEDPMIEGGVNQANNKSGQVNPIQKEYEGEKEKQNRLIYNLPISIISGEATMSPEDMKSIPLELQDDYKDALEHDPVMSDDYLRELFQVGGEEAKELKKLFHYFEINGEPHFRYKDTYSFMKGSGRVADLRSSLGEGSAAKVKSGLNKTGEAIARVENGVSFKQMRKHLNGLLENGDITPHQYSNFVSHFKQKKDTSASKLDPELNKSLIDSVKSLGNKLNNRITSDQGFSIGTNPFTNKPFMSDPKGKAVEQKAKDWINKNVTELKYHLRGKSYEEGEKIIALWNKRISSAIETGILGKDGEILLMSEEKLNAGYEEAVTMAKQKETLTGKSLRDLEAIYLDNKGTTIGNIALSMILEKRESIKEKEDARDTSSSK